LVQLNVNFTFLGELLGEFQLFYFFVRERLGWDVVKFGSFSSYNWFTAVTGVALSMGILSKWMQLPDPVVGFIVGMSQILLPMVL
jgi:hypothetical protein